LFRRKRFSRYRPPKEKNYYQAAGVGLAAGATSIEILAVADDLSNANSVAIPSRIRAVYVEFFVKDNAQTGGTRVSWCMVKNPGSIYSLAQIDPSQLEASNLLSSIIRAGQMSTPQQSGYGFAGWIKIPPRHQRFAENDRLEIRFNSAEASTLCMLATYKWET